MINLIDEVHCNNCESNHRVPIVETTCPNCGKDGCLEWLDDPWSKDGTPGPIQKPDSDQ
jgi:hypothetical protein